jgi:xanthine/CO dehydrogenase XdhC/CoxF family maturation factor
VKIILDEAMSIHATLAELERGHLDAALCTVVAISGSTPRKPGAKMIVIDNNEDFGRIIGTIGGGAIESTTFANARFVRYEGDIMNW